MPGPYDGNSARLERDREPPISGEHLEREHGVCDRDVLQELLPRLEVGQERADPRVVTGRVAGREGGDESL